MTTPDDLDILDPDWRRWDPDNQPASYGDVADHMARVARKLRYTTTELAERRRLFDREHERLTARAEEVCGPLEREQERLEQMLTAWLEHEQRQAENDGRQPPKTLHLPDATVKSRTTTRVDLAPGGDVRDIPDRYVRTKREPDRNAISAAIRDGDLTVTDNGHVVTGLGSVVPVTIETTTNYTVQVANQTQGDKQ